MAHEIKRNGETVRVLLNPSEKGFKYSQELRGGIRLTNNYDPKYDENGQVIELTPSEISYRLGYLASRSDSSKAFNHKHGKKSKKQRRLKK